MAREWGQMTRALSRRLGRLEEQLKPAEEPRIWQVVIVDSNGGRTDGPQVAWRRLDHWPTGADVSNIDGSVDSWMAR